MINSKRRQEDRVNLLADVAEMYFLEGKNQAEIAKIIGVTRSNVSRMLTEARNSGIIKIEIQRPLRENHALAQALVECFNFKKARVVEIDRPDQRLSKIALAASLELQERLQPGIILGTSWGTAISATVESLEKLDNLTNVKIAQLLGAFGARIKEYDGHAILRRLEHKLNGEGIYINAPFLVEDENVAQSLLTNRSVGESLAFGKRADLALLGVGSSELEYSSYYLANYVTKEEMAAIQQAGSIGDVCGRFFDINGKSTALEFQKRLIGISREDLLNIPLRMGVAGGDAKVNPIIGALRGKFINILITDVKTAQAILRQTDCIN